METRPAYETDPAELAALRKRLAELAVDLPGTLAQLSPEAQQEYRDAEQSVVDARNKVHGREGLIVISS